MLKQGAGFQKNAEGLIKIIIWKAKRRINKLRANYRSKIETINPVIKRIEGSTVRASKLACRIKKLY